MTQSVLARFAAVIAFGAVSASIAIAQPPKRAKSLQFEVAAIKPSNPKRGIGSSMSGNGPGGQFRIVNMPLSQWIEIGLSVSDYALKAPSWLDNSRFDLDARPPVGEFASAEMMKALLIERFGLKWHEERQTVSGYELVADKKVLVKPSSMLEKLKGEHGATRGRTIIGGKNMPMSELAAALEKVLRRPVVDATHLSGGFDFKLMWRPIDDAAVAEQKKYGIDVDDLPATVFDAVREQLGLRLQVAKVPSTVIVVDQINHQPTQN